MADAFLRRTFGIVREVAGDRGELAGRGIWEATITRTPTVTTNRMSVFLTATGATGGRVLFAGTPLIVIGALAGFAGANAAATDFRGAWPGTYNPATGELVFAALKGVNVILASGDGEHTFHIVAIGQAA
jgi:hypothetical protein